MAPEILHVCLLNVHSRQQPGAISAHFTGGTAQAFHLRVKVMGLCPQNREEQCSTAQIKQKWGQPCVYTYGATFNTAVDLFLGRRHRASIPLLRISNVLNLRTGLQMTYQSYSNWKYLMAVSEKGDRRAAWAIKVRCKSREARCFVLLTSDMFCADRFVFSEVCSDPTPPVTPFDGERKPLFFVKRSKRLWRSPPETLS